ncbi:hypothetical protein, partial [Falsiroseomonas oryziterrae]|uniref:hypothetical protein n=1 Tax=Falsiroseomonas oryziterrae TaxID=2911368 RepID=UPI001F1FF8F5
MSGSDLWPGPAGARGARPGGAGWLLFGVPLALLIGFVGVPGIKERTSSPCLGLEQLAVRTALDLPSAGDGFRGPMVQVMANTLRRAGLTGAAGARAAGRLHPGLPAPLGCLIGHWQVTLSPAEQAPAWLAA